MSDDPQILVVGPRRRGRPPLSRTERSVGVYFKLTESQFDEACKVAAGTGDSLPSVVRLALARFLADERGGVLRYTK